MPKFLGERKVFQSLGRAARARRRSIGAAHAHGAVSPKVLAVLVLVLVAAFAAWWFLGRGNDAVTAPASTVAKPGAASSTATSAQPEAQTELTVDQLYGAARKAMADNRIVSPAGENALEYYLRILDKQPDNNNAKDALRELFPFATAGVEDQINQNNMDEATRIMDLLAKADPSNYTLTILRSKMDARKKQNDRDQAQKDALAAAAAAAAAARTTPAGQAPATAEAAATPATATGSQTAATPATKPAEVAKATPPPETAPAAAPPPTGESRDVRVVTAPRPAYPPAAARNRQSGWVEVEFTVAASGEVQNAHVTASQPSRVFDREAVRAVENAKFDPKLVNGQPVASTLRRRIEFNLAE